jgi:hypothetical protein
MLNKMLEKNQRLDVKKRTKTEIPLYSHFDILAFQTIR